MDTRWMLTFKDEKGVRKVETLKFRNCGMTEVVYLLAQVLREEIEVGWMIEEITLVADPTGGQDAVPTGGHQTPWSDKEVDMRDLR